MKGLKQRKIVNLKIRDTGRLNVNGNSRNHAKMARHLILFSQKQVANSEKHKMCIYHSLFPYFQGSRDASGSGRSGAILGRLQALSGRVRLQGQLSLPHQHAE